MCLEVNGNKYNPSNYDTKQQYINNKNAIQLLSVIKSMFFYMNISSM